MITELIKKELPQRDQSWENQFLIELPKGHFKLLQDFPIQGPDGMPYLPVDISEVGEPAEKILPWLGEKGVGLVVSPDKRPPDFVLTFGMIWNYLSTGHFVEEIDSKKVSSKEFELVDGQEFFAGVPNEQYWPPHARQIFREFLKDQKVEQPKVLMISEDKKDFDLCFSWESLGKPPKEEWQGVLEGFSWFFPLHYSLSILSETAIKGFEFVDL